MVVALCEFQIQIPEGDLNLLLVSPFESLPLFIASICADSTGRAIPSTVLCPKCSRRTRPMLALAFLEPLLDAGFRISIERCANQARDDDQCTTKISCLNLDRLPSGCYAAKKVQQNRKAKVERP